MVDVKRAAEHHNDGSFFNTKGDKLYCNVDHYNKSVDCNRPDSWLTSQTPGCVDTTMRLCPDQNSKVFGPAAMNECFTIPEWLRPNVRILDLSKPFDRRSHQRGIIEDFPMQCQEAWLSHNLMDRGKYCPFANTSQYFNGLTSVTMAKQQLAFIYAWAWFGLGDCRIQELVLSDNVIYFDAGRIHEHGELPGGQVQHWAGIASPGTYEPFPNLKRLDLSGNQLQSFNGSLFYGIEDTIEELRLQALLTPSPTTL